MKKTILSVVGGVLLGVVFANRLRALPVLNKIPAL